MSSHTPRVWLKNPLGIFTGTDADASGGLVVAEGRIAETVPTGAAPPPPRWTRSSTPRGTSSSPA